MKVKILIIFIFVFFSSTFCPLFSQCAMCKIAVESNVNSGENSLGAGLNTGILYLLVVPYLAIASIAFFWYINSKKNHADLTYRRNIIRKVSSL